MAKRTRPKERQIFGNPASTPKAKQEPKTPKKPVNQVLEKGEQVGSWDFRKFNTLYHFDKFVAQQMNRLSANNRREQVAYEGAFEYLNGQGWFGFPKPASLKELDKYTKFDQLEKVKQRKKELSALLNRAKKLKPNQLVPSKKLAFNDRGLGIFSFDRAATGLYKKVDENGHAKIVTSIKTVYAYHQKRTIEQKAIKIYARIGAPSNVKGNDVFNVGIGIALLSEELEKQGFQTEINLIIGTQYGEKVTAGIVRMKRYDTKLRINDLLVMAASAKYYRWKGFKGLIALYDAFGKNLAPEFGRSPSYSTILHFVDELEKNNAGTYFVFGANYTPAGTIEEIERALKMINQ